MESVSCEQEGYRVSSYNSVKKHSTVPRGLKSGPEFLEMGVTMRAPRKLNFFFRFGT